MMATVNRLPVCSRPCVVMQNSINMRDSIVRGLFVACCLLLFYSLVDFDWLVVGISLREQSEVVRYEW